MECITCGARRDPKHPRGGEMHEDWCSEVPVVPNAPSSAQLFRGVALSAAAEVIGRAVQAFSAAGDDIEVPTGTVEALAARWAKWIETGEAEEANGSE